VLVGSGGRRESLLGWVSSILGLLRPPVRLPEPFTRVGCSDVSPSAVGRDCSVIIFCWSRLRGWAWAVHTGVQPLAPGDSCRQSDVRGWVLAMTATVPPLFGPDMLTDPYAMYARVRGPVTWNEQMGLWLITRYDDVRWALGGPRPPRCSSSFRTSAQSWHKIRPAGLRRSRS
jgi:hypothetical protein